MCSEILCRIPFKKTSIRGEIVQIDSKNQVDEEDAAQLEQLIQNQEVILTHSATLQLEEDHCRGIVEKMEYEKKNLKVRVSSETGYSIWEDTDIWMFSLSTPTSSDCTTEPNTSADTEPPPPEEDTLKPAKSLEEMDQTELFESINGWKLMDKKRLRMRRKEDGRWRNVYLVELTVTCLDPEKQELLMHVEERTALRLSADIEDLGVVLVDVIRKSVNEEEGKLKTITIGVTGFLSREVDIPLTADTTLYLNIYDMQDDDVGSMASEEGILPGFPLVQNLDELCEKVGELTIIDVGARLWYTDNTEFCYIRLLVTSQKNMSNFKKLTGHHVIVTSLTNDENRTHVLGVVNRVFSEEMVLTLKAVPNHSKEFFFSKKEGLTIQIAHEYEDRLLHEKCNLERLRFDLANSTSNIRFERYWRETSNDNTRSYAAFTVKNEEFLRIPMNTRVLLGKCYEIHAPVEKKADFTIARRVSHVTVTTELMLVFEVINTTHLVEDSGSQFKINKAYYYVDFDGLEDIRRETLKHPKYCLLNARNAKDPEEHTMAKRTPIGKEFKFFVFPYEERFQAKNQKKRRIQMLKAKPTVNNPPVQNLPLQKPLKRVVQTRLVEDSTTHPEDPSPSRGNQPWKMLETLPAKVKSLCYVQITDPIGYEKNNILLNIHTGLDENGETKKTAPFRLGRQIAITGGKGQNEIRIRGHVYDTDKISESRSDSAGQATVRYGVSVQTQEGSAHQEQQEQQEQEPPVDSSLPLF